MCDGCKQSCVISIKSACGYDSAKCELKMYEIEVTACAYSDSLCLAPRLIRSLSTGAWPHQFVAPLAQTHCIIMKMNYICKHICLWCRCATRCYNVISAHTQASDATAVKSVDLVMTVSIHMCEHYRVSMAVKCKNQYCEYIDLHIYIYIICV
jgi:hypothetical protein